MKKLAALFFILFALTFSFFSQTGETEKNLQPNAHYETIKWDSVAKSRKYQVDIEKVDDKGKWKKVFSKQTKDTSLEVLLEPGSYRVSISTFNILGKKTASEWTEFQVLNEKIPYLFNNYYKKDPNWNVPVLYIDFKNNDLSKLDGYENFIKAEQGFSENSFFIKGKNIFSPSTTFSLIPSNSALDEGKPYTPIFDERKTVPLTILQRDTKKGGVYVSYEPDSLFTGYYKLEAKNASNTSSYGIFVFADRKLNISPEGFEQDLRYKVNSFYIPSSGNVKLSLVGVGITSMSRFTLIPSYDDGINYPLAEIGPRGSVELSVEATSVVSAAGFVQVDFLCDSQKLTPGYYYINVENEDNDSAKVLVLAKIRTDQDNGIEINKVKTKFNKRTKKIDFTIIGKNFDKDAELSILSEFSNKTASNNRVDLSNINYSATKLTASVPAEDVVFGNYALLIKNKKGFSSFYFYIDKHFRSNSISLSPEKAEALFLRPESELSTIDFNSNIKEKIDFFENKVRVIQKVPPLFPYFRFTFDLNMADLSSIAFKFEFDIINVNWFYLDLGVKYNPSYDAESEGSNELGAELFARITYPGYMLCPFIGLGVGYNLVDPQCGFNLINLPSGFESTSTIASNGFLGSSDLYFMGQAGFILMQFFDIRYTFEMHYFLNDNQDYQIKNMLSIGTRIPLRRASYVRQVLSRGASITKAGGVYAYDYDNLSDVDEIKFDRGVTEINGFENNKKLESVTVSNTVTSLGAKAFKDCSNLSEVVFEEDSSLKVISSQAFANDKLIKLIRIPESVTKIEEFAFENWTNGQTIYLGWPRNSDVKRDLSGLENTNALIIYEDNQVYNPLSYQTVFNNPENWKNVVLGINNDYSNVFVYKDNSYHSSIKVNGIIRTDKEDFIYRNSPALIVNTVKFAKKIKFSVLGDGNKYMLCVVTRDGGCFAKEFKTKSEDVKHISISMNSLKRMDSSKVRKLDKQQIVFVQIVPVVEINRSCLAYFYDFEVQSNEK